MTSMSYPTATDAWLSWLRRILNLGAPRAPRNQQTLEIPHLSTSFKMEYPIVKVPERKLSYKFLNGEALWILNGDDRVKTIAPYNKNLIPFSDDGVTFAGAYGPPFVEQMPYVARSIMDDLDTRQAVITLWRPSPSKTKDVPCTVALQFQVRGAAQLDVHVFMRSSDAWLGVPYDWFNFTMMGLRVAHAVNAYTGQYTIASLGRLYFTAGSAHLYTRNRIGVEACLAAPLRNPGPPDLPRWIVTTGEQELVNSKLIEHRDAGTPWSVS